MRNRIAVVAGVVGVLGVLAFAGRELAPVTLLGAGDKVDICHFPGHESSVTPGLLDFKIKTKGVPAGTCEAAGGNVISVSANALAGHRIVEPVCPPDSKTCP